MNLLLLIHLLQLTKLDLIQTYNYNFQFYLIPDVLKKLLTPYVQNNQVASTLSSDYDEMYTLSTQILYETYFYPMFTEIQSKIVGNVKRLIVK